ncbi:hypothetical protein [Pseudomonas putida]|uniref:Uncharacterized protein n=1 Tax=Pseudomonas putida TaxID=303 RepID=A0AAW5HES8_PSEPU|nr:hypothetical protein [Pseudomonas putida]MCO1619053.1 hypothetical protein [Pseudomonas putida]
MKTQGKSGFDGRVLTGGSQTRAIVVAPSVKDELLGDKGDNTVLAKYLRDEAFPMVVTIETPWEEMASYPGDFDTVKFYHKQTGGGVFKTIEFHPGDEDKFPYHLELPKDLVSTWGDGPNTIHYEVDHYNFTHSVSPELTLLFDRAAPYNQTAPDKMPDLPATVTDATKGAVELELPDYLDYQPGDKVAYWWLASIPDDPWAALPVAVVEVTVRPQKLPVPATTIDQVGDGGVMAVYVLLDKAGNNSHMSDITHIAVALGNLPSNLKEPVVPLAADGLINQQDAADGVIVQVPAFDNWKPSDQLRVTWGSYTSQWRPISDTGKFPQEFAIQPSTLFDEYGASTTGDKAVPVAYEVQRGTAPVGNKGTSVTVNLERIGPVDPDPDPEWPGPVNPRLETVTITGSAGEKNHLKDPDDEFKDATLTLDVNLALKKDDELTFYWGDEHIQGIDHTVGDGEPGTTITKTVAWAVIRARGNDTVPVHYRVQRPGNPNPIRSVDTDVLVEAVGIHPAAPEYLGTVRDWLNCSSLYQDEHDTEAAVSVQMEDLTQYGLASGDTVTLHWSAVHGRTGEDVVAGAALDEAIVLNETTEKGFVWKVPFETNVKQIYDPANNRPEGRGRVKYSFSLGGKSYESETKEAMVSMHDGGGSCPLRPKP